MSAILLLALSLLVLPNVIHCAASGKGAPPAPREKLIPIMKEFLRMSGEFKRALLIHERGRYAPLAKGILERAATLKGLSNDRDFLAFSENLRRRAEKLTSDLPDIEQKRIEVLFKDMTAECLACHRQFRY